MNKHQYLKNIRNNQLMNDCHLEIGFSFIFQGDICIIKSMHSSYFRYHNQKNNRTYEMTYGRYLETPSAAGRNLHRLNNLIKYGN
jgi:hypothetical protein